MTPQALDVRAWLYHEGERPNGVTPALWAMWHWARVLSDEDRTLLLAPSLEGVARSESRASIVEWRMVDGILRHWLPAWLDTASGGSGMSPGELAAMLRDLDPITSDCSLVHPSWGAIVRDEPCDGVILQRRMLRWSGADLLDTSIEFCAPAAISTARRLALNCAMRQRDIESGTRAAGQAMAEVVYGAVS